MKKTLLILTLLVMLIALGIGLTISASAEEYSGNCGKGVTWKLDTTTGDMVISGNGVIDYHANTGSSYTPWYSKRTSILKVTIENGVTSIGGGAFKGCSSLTSITIPDSVTSIGEYAFCGCNSLTSIAIPNSVTFIDHSAFSSCNSLTSITIPDSVTSIGNYTFFGCSNLISITIPDNVTSIGEYAFGGCNSLTYVYITDIAAWCNIKFSDTPLLYDGNLYLNNELITELVIPDSVTSIGNYVFWGCDSLTSITIPDSVTSIGKYAFSGCDSLTSIAIPNSVTSIGRSAFSYCSSLTSITIPNSVIFIDYDAFFFCHSLKNVYITDIAAWCNIKFSDTPLLYAGNLYLNNELVTELVIPDSVTNIGTAFQGCGSLTSVAFPKNIVIIEESVFQSCDKLATIKIPTSIQLIKRNAFYNCTSLKKIIYCGTEAQWNAIGKVTDWDKNTGSYTVMYHDCEWTNANAEQHKGVCSMCSEEIFADHTWDNGAITTPSSHIAEGVKTFTCTDCGETKTESVDKLTGHTYNSYEKHNAQQHKKLCVCGDIQYADHAWDNGAITTPSSHIAEGVKTFTCIDCGETKTEAIAKLTDHTYGAWTKHNQTQHKKTCECGKTLYEAHLWSSEIIMAEPTHSTEGIKTFLCITCGEAKTEKIDKLPGHTYGEWVTTKEAAEGVEGVREKTCVCGDKITETIPALEIKQTEPVVTDIPSIPTSDDDTATKPSDDKASNDGDTKDKSGCGSTVSGGIGLICLFAVATLGVALKKKKAKI